MSWIILASPGSWGAGHMAECAPDTTLHQIAIVVWPQQSFIGLYQTACILFQFVLM